MLTILMLNFVPLITKYELIFTCYKEPYKVHLVNAHIYLFFYCTRNLPEKSG